MHNSSAWLLVVMLALAALLTSKRDSLLVSAIDNAFAGWVMSVTPGEKQEATQLAIVEIDEASLELTDGWPWQPIDYAIFLQAVNAAQASVVAIDHPVQWGDQKPTYLDLMVNTAFQTPNLLLPYYGVPAASQLDEQTPANLRETRLLDLGGDRTKLASVICGVHSATELLQTAKSTMLPSLAVEAELANGNSLLIAERNQQIVPTLSFEAWRIHKRGSLGDLYIQLGESIDISGSPVCQISEFGGILVDYRMLAKVPRLSYRELLTAYERVKAGDDVADTELNILNNRIVLLGRVDAEAKKINSSIGTRISRVEQLAATITTIFRGKSFVPANHYVWFVLALGYGILGLLVLKLNRKGAILLALAICCCYPLVAATAAQLSWQLYPLALPVACTVVLMLIALSRKKRPA